MKLLKELRALAYILRISPSIVIERYQNSDALIKKKNQELWLASDETRKVTETLKIVRRDLLYYTTIFCGYSGVQLKVFATELNWLRLENIQLKNKLLQISKNNDEADYIIPRNE